MPPSEKDLAYLWDMLEAAKDIYTFTIDQSMIDSKSDQASSDHMILFISAI